MLALTLLAGCGANAGGLNGDFGRVRQSLQSDDMHAWVGPAAWRPATTPPWQHQLTEDERRLRDYAYPLIEPPYNRNQWYSVIYEYGQGNRAWPYPDRSAYASRLFQTSFRSQNGRYGRLIEDIRNDVSRLDLFFGSARIVSDMDRRRDKSIAYVSGLTKEELANTTNRIRENEAIVSWVQQSIRERSASYRVALERMVLAAPSPMAVEAERALALFEQRAGAYGV